jgi:hypothetical protein
MMTPRSRVWYRHSLYAVHSTEPVVLPRGCRLGKASHYAEAMMVRGRWMLAGIASVLALVATGTATPAFTEGAALLGTSGNERSPALAAELVGADVAVLGTKLEHFGHHLWSARHGKGRAAIPPLAMVAAAWGVSVIWRRCAVLRRVPLVVAHPLSGIAPRAPPLLQLTGR